MANNELGDATGRTQTITVEASDDITAGDVVAIEQSEDDARFPPAEPAQDDTTPNIDQVAGVANEGIDDGERGTVTLSGPVIANVADNVNAGERLGTGTTAGQFVSEDEGLILALSDEEGTDRAGTELGENEAEVFL